MRKIRTLGVAVAVIGLAGRADAQATYEACYVPSVGAIYLIKLTGLPAACLAQTHVAFSWTEGGGVADGSVTEAKLAFDPATQAELDALMAALAAAGTINTATNPVDWSQLKNVPADFADGVDDGGGTSSDLVCTGCVGATDLANSAVTTAKVANGAVTETKLSFDPATQAELDGVTGGLAATGTINTPTNPVDWTQLKNVPAGFADGVDAGGGVSDHGALSGLTDDDHPQYLAVNGTRNATDGLAVTGTLGAGTIPASGAGVRLMWYPGKAAFRVGEVAGEWDDASIGTRSVAMGLNTTASGLQATAMGGGTTANGNNATAMGAGTVASGNSATAMGVGTDALGEGSAAMGVQTTASGVYATAMGFVTTAQAYGSLVIGRYNVVGGTMTSWVTNEPLFVAGNGTSASSPANALTLFKDGDLTIAGTLTESSDLRFKEAISPIESALDGVSRLRPVRYRFREGTGHPTEPQIGLIAQEVEQVFPELVARDAQGYLSVAYTDLAAVLVRAVQEQQETIQALRAEVAALRAAVADRDPNR